jgi:hypothetical protein
LNEAGRVTVGPEWAKDVGEHVGTELVGEVAANHAEMGAGAVTGGTGTFVTASETAAEGAIAVKRYLDRSRNTRANPTMLAVGNRASHTSPSAAFL